MGTRLLALCIIALCACSLSAQRAASDTSLRNTDKPYVQATGEATVSVKPDQAVVQIGVIAQGATATVAAAQNAKQTDTVIGDLKRLLGAAAKLRTTSYSVRPNYQTPKPGTTPSISGYTATNIVEVTLDDLTQVSKVIDTATASGANVIQGLQYQLKNPGATRAQALRQAAEQAKAAAEAIAGGLGVKVARILSSEEVNLANGGPVFARAAAMTAATPTPTPLEIGMIDVTVNVMVRAEITQ